MILTFRPILKSKSFLCSVSLESYDIEIVKDIHPMIISAKEHTFSERFILDKEVRLGFMRLQSRKNVV